MTTSPKDKPIKRPKAEWGVDELKSRIKDNGSLVVTAILKDNGVAVAKVRLSVSRNRILNIGIIAPDEANEFADFRVWLKQGEI